MPVKTATCPHFWKIDSPDGPTSKAHCKFCGAEKEFDNVIEADPNRPMVKRPTEDPLFFSERAYSQTLDVSFRR